MQQYRRGLAKIIQKKKKQRERESEREREGTSEYFISPTIFFFIDKLPKKKERKKKLATQIGRRCVLGETKLKNIEA
jgi:hypothetical protein